MRQVGTGRMRRPTATKRAAAAAALPAARRWCKEVRFGYFHWSFISNSNWPIYVPEDLQDISESFHPEDGEANAASTSQESLAASPAPVAAAEEGNVQGSQISGSNF